MPNQPRPAGDATNNNLANKHPFPCWSWLCCWWQLLFMTAKQSLSGLMSALNIEDRAPDVEKHVLVAREFYTTLPYRYPRDAFVYDFYGEGLATLVTFDEIHKSFEQRLSMNQLFFLAASSVGLHYHKS